MHKLQQLFDAMRHSGTFENATILIHGDHGSRISRIDPIAQNAAQLTVDDYMDSFSTLFAVKAPDIASAVDSRMLPLPQLLSYATNGRDTIQLPNTSPNVFLADGASRFVKTPIPDFPSSAQ